MKLLSVLLVCSLVLFVACEDSAEEDPMITEERNVDLFAQEVEGVVTEDVANGVRGFVARPEIPGEYPGVIMIHEWWGLNENIKEMAQILASEGYVVFAVDLYGGEVAQTSDEARVLATAVREDPEQAVEEMRAAVAYLREEQGVERVASLGWCFGGQQSLLLSVNEDVNATVIYYGSLIEDKEQLDNLEGPVLGIFGEEDSSIPVSSVRTFESSLNELGVENEIYIYPGVGHAFANPSGSNYAAEETVDAWEKTVEFLAKNIKE